MLRTVEASAAATDYLRLFREQIAYIIRHGGDSALIVARPDARWGERPVLVAVVKPGASFTREDMHAHYEGKTSRWCVPGDVVIVPDLPHTATGKLSKKAIRRIILDDLAWRTPNLGLES